MLKRGKQELPSQLSILVADEKMPKFNFAVNEVTVKNLQLNKKSTLTPTGGKTGKGLRSPSFHHSAPNLAEVKMIKGITIRAERIIKEGAPSPKAFYATEAQSMENLATKCPAKLAPLEIPLEVKEAQLQKMMSFQRDAQLSAFKRAISSETHGKRVTNLAQVEVGNLHQIKLAEKTTLEHQDRTCSLAVSKLSCEVQIALPTEGNPKLQKNPIIKDTPMPCHNPLISQNLHDLQESSKMADRLSQENGKHHFRLKPMEAQGCLCRAKPLKAMGSGMEEGRQKMAGLRAHKTLTDASKLLENIAKKHRGWRDESDELDEDLLVRMQSSRRMALGDIIQVDED